MYLHRVRSSLTLSAGLVALATAISSWAVCGNALPPQLLAPSPLTLHDPSGNVIREESRVPRDAAGVPTAPQTQPDPPTVTRHGYDALDREYKTCFGGDLEIDFDEPWELGCTWKSFDDAGRLIVQVDERGYATTFDYDNANRRTKTCGPSGQPDGTPFTSSTDFAALTCADVAPDIETAYDRDGRVVSTKDPGLAFQVPHYDAAGRREFDCRHLPGQETDPPDDPRDSIDIPGITCRAFETDALGRVIAETDEDGHRTAFAFDEVGRLVSVTDARGKVTRYEFDDRGSMVSQTDALERVTRYEQDSAGRRVARVLPMLQRETFAYTVTGALRQHLDFLGRTTTADSPFKRPPLLGAILPRFALREQNTPFSDVTGSHPPGSSVPLPRARRNTEPQCPTPARP